jgi:hypothetical protein
MPENAQANDQEAHELDSKLSGGNESLIERLNIDEERELIALLQEAIGADQAHFERSGTGLAHTTRTRSSFAETPRSLLSPAAVGNTEQMYVKELSHLVFSLDPRLMQ